MCVCVCTQSCPTLCDPMDCSPPGSSIHGILQARILEWVAISSSRGSSRPKDEILVSMSPALANGFFTTSDTWEALKCGKCSQSVGHFVYVKLHPGVKDFSLHLINGAVVSAASWHDFWATNFL